MKRPLLLIPALLFFASLPLFAQEQTTQQPSAEELEKQKAVWSKNAYRLLDQVISEAQALRLTENRVRVQINAADMLWEQDESRARSLFMQASDGITEIMRTQDSNQRGNAQRRPNQLRQELVLAVARHDAPLAYQLLAATRPPANVPSTTLDPQNANAVINTEDNLEQMLLARVAALDPKLAAQNAEQMLEKGQFPRSVTDVINNLERQDAEAAAKLRAKTISKLQSANILTNGEAASLAIALISPGPKLQTTTTASTEPTPDNQNRNQRAPVLDQSTYTELLSTIIDSALKATSTQQNTNQRGPNQRGPQPVQGAGGGRAQGPNTRQNQPPTDAQMEQINSRRLLANLQQALPQIDLYLPSRSQAVRQKLTELGINNTSRQPQPELFAQIAQGNVTAETIMQAAPSMPPQMQPRVYQQAAARAMTEGNFDLARQIANDRLQGNARSNVLKRIAFVELAKKAEGAGMEEIRMELARLSNDNERIDLLLQIAGGIAKNNPKMATQVLEEAKQLTSRRATSYENFDQQLKVANAFAVVAPARSFEVLDPGITQLNELLNAAAVLNGFEVNIFRDGELPLQGGSGLAATITRYGQTLALLARTDFERSEMLAGHFQLPEPRIMTRLSIVQGLLGREQRPPLPNQFRAFGQNVTIRQ